MGDRTYGDLAWDVNSLTDELETLLEHKEEAPLDKVVARLRSLLPDDLHCKECCGFAGHVGDCSQKPDIDPHMDATYIKGWEDACTQVSDAINVRSMARHNPNRAQMEEANAYVIRAREVVTTVSRRAETWKKTKTETTTR